MTGHDALVITVGVWVALQRSIEVDLGSPRKTSGPFFDMLGSCLWTLVGAAPVFVILKWGCVR